VQVGFLANTFVSGDTLPQQVYGLAVGTDADNTTYYSGYLDDLQISSNILNATDVVNLYNQTIHVNPKSARVVGGPRRR
jgi:hypothetical protein